MSTLIERLDELKKQLMATTNFHPYAHVVIEARAALDRDFENELQNAFKRGLQAGNEQADKQQQAIIELDVENARLRADAERYRFFRNPPKPTATGDMQWAELGSLHGAELDAAIDAAKGKHG